MKRQVLSIATLILAGCLAQPQVEPTVAVTLEGLTLQAPETSFPVDSSVQLRTFGHYSDGTRVEVTSRTTWSSSLPSIGRVEAPGLVRLVGVGATRLDGRFEDRTVSVTLVASGARLDGVQLVTADTGPLNSGAQRQFALKARAADGKVFDVTRDARWSVAGLPSALTTTPGLVVGTQPGRWVVQADYRGFSAGFELFVLPAQVTDLEILAAGPVIRPGDVRALVLRATFSDGARQVVTSDATWVTSDARVFEVAAPGIVIARAPGSAQIGASWAGRTTTLDLHSIELQVVGLGFESSTVQVPVGGTLAQPLLLDLNDGTRRDVAATATWTVSQPDLLTVSHGRLLAHGVGAVTVTARVEEREASIEVQITAPVLTGLRSTLRGTRLPVGLKATVVFEGQYSDGAVVNVSELVQVDAASLTVVRAAGWLEVSGLVPGRPTLVARLGGQKVSSAMEITDATVSGFQIQPISEDGMTAKAFAAVVSWSDGVSTDATELTQWTAVDGAVVELSNVPGERGQATAGEGGFTSVNAEFFGHTATLAWNFALP